MTRRLVEVAEKAKVLVVLPLPRYVLAAFFI
jgi:hypothetical protein